MTTLYSLRCESPDGQPNGNYRITKFVDGEPEGSYITTDRECECPAGHRATCRHRQMLPYMLAAEITNTHWFLNYDTSQIVDFAGGSKRLYDQLAATAMPVRPDAILPDGTMIDYKLAASAKQDTAPSPQRASWRRM